MKLQKQLSRKVGNITYAKYVVVIPPQTIKELQWKEGEELETKIKEQTLTIKKHTKNEQE